MNKFMVYFLVVLSLFGYLSFSLAEGTKIPKKVNSKQNQLPKRNLGKKFGVEILKNKTFDFKSPIESPNPETQLGGFVTFFEKGKAEILDGGDMVLQAIYTQDKSGQIIVRSTLNSAVKKFKILDSKTIVDEFNQKWIQR